MTDSIIRVPRVIRTGPFSALPIWPPDAAGIAATESSAWRNRYRETNQ